MQLLGVSDLVKRWCYTRQGIHGLAKRDDFPKPFGTIDAGRMKIWLLSDIVTYEKRHPEVLDERKKEHKVKGYFLTLQRAGRF